MFLNLFIPCIFLITVHSAPKSLESDETQLISVSEFESEWIVRGDNEEDSRACLLGAGNVRIQQQPSVEGGVLIPDVVLPQVMTGVEGRCGLNETELTLSWLNEDGDDNQLNLIFSRRGMLAALTGVFLSLSSSSSTQELTASMHPAHYLTLQWPHRYGLHCPREFSIELYPAPTNLMDRNSEAVVPVAHLILKNLRLEVFRYEYLEEQFPGKFVDDIFSLRTWECEFHFVFDWAPVLVGGGLTMLIVVMLCAFTIKQYGKKSQNQYDIL